MMTESMLVGNSILCQVFNLITFFNYRVEKQKPKYNCVCRIQLFWGKSTPRLQQSESESKQRPLIECKCFLNYCL